MTAHTVELMFLYHAGLELERTQLKAPEMRSAHGGALKASAKAHAQSQKPLSQHACSKKQQQELCRMALARAAKIDRKRYFQHGPLALVQLKWEEQQWQRAFR